MDKTAVKKALRTPYKPLLDYAMTFVSLSEKERKVLMLCFVELLTEQERVIGLNRGELLTEEKTAEILGYSRDFVAKTKKRALERVLKAWEKIPEVIEQMNQY